MIILLIIIVLSQLHELFTRKKKKDCWETFMFDTACWLNIAGIF